MASRKGHGGHSGQQERPWDSLVSQCFMSLVNPHDGLPGIDTVVTVGFALWKESQTAGVTLMSGSGQQFGYCWGPVGPVMCTMLVVVGGERGRDRPGSELSGREVF